MTFWRGHTPNELSSPLVNTPAMTDANYLHEALVVFDGIDDADIADSNPVVPVGPCKLAAAAWSRAFGERFDGGQHPGDLGPVQSSSLLPGRLLPFNSTAGHPA